MNFSNNRLPTIIIIIILIGIFQNNLCINSNASTKNQANVAVLISNPQDPYLDLITQGLKNIEKNNRPNMRHIFGLLFFSCA